MRRIKQKQLLANQFLPILTLIAALIAEPIAISAQQRQPEKSSVPGAPATESAFQPSPEDVGDSLYVNHRYQAAIEAYKKAPADSPDVWNKMGIAYEVLLDLKDAERCFKQSLRLRPEYAWAMSNLATVYDSLGDLRKSERLYRKSMKIDPNSAITAANLGTNLMMQKKYDDGWQMYKRALSLNRHIFKETESPRAQPAASLQQAGAINYYKAKGFAQAGMVTSAIRYLRKAMDEGFASPTEVAEDRSFDRLHGNPRFERLLAEQKRD